MAYTKKLIDNVIKGAENGVKAEKIFAEANRLYAENEYVQAIELWKQAAEQGHAGAQYNMGVCYEEGIGFEADLTEARVWYERAAEQ